MQSETDEISSDNYQIFTEHLNNVALRVIMSSQRYGLQDI